MNAHGECPPRHTRILSHISHPQNPKVPVKLLHPTFVHNRQTEYRFENVGSRGQRLQHSPGLDCDLTHAGHLGSLADKASQGGPDHGVFPSGHSTERKRTNTRMEGPGKLATVNVESSGSWPVGTCMIGLTVTAFRNIAVKL